MPEPPEDPKVFEEKATVFFAGDGDGAAAIAAGCTKAWWDAECPNHTEAEHVAARDKMMDEDGAPLCDEETYYYAPGGYFYVANAESKGVEVGMVAYFYNGSYVDTGMYEITEVDGGTIKCAGVTKEDSDYPDIIIGGEFLLQDALDETDATEHSVEIHVRDNLTLSSTIDIDAGGGSAAHNSFKRIKAYNTSPGDMDLGGTYYQSPLEILQAGSIDGTKAVLIDGDDSDFEIFDVAVDNIIIENFHCYNTGSANVLLFTGTPQNIVFRNCRFSSGSFVMQAAATSVLIDSCYSHSDLTGNHYQMSGNANIILNCVGNVAADKIFAVAATVEGSQIIGCLAVNGANGLRVFGYEIIAINNTFYNQTVHGIDVADGVRVIAYNNIFSLYPGAIALSIITAGSYPYNDYNCFIESDGTPLTVGSHGSGYEAPVLGAHSVQVDPDFVDAANSDFRVRNPVVLRGGRPGPDGRAAVIGAIGQEYQFAERARVMNAGRAGIIR